MKLPKHINDWETTEDWENVWVVEKRYTNIFNEGLVQADKGNVMGFVKMMSAVADVKNSDEDNLYVLPEDSHNKIVAKAQMHLANFFLFGAKVTENGNVIKTKKDTKKAVYYMTLAAENGNVDAQQNLATMYESGIDSDGEPIPNIKKDYNVALKWYHLAAKQGSELAKKDGTNLYNMIRN